MAENTKRVHAEQGITVDEAIKEIVGGTFLDGFTETTGTGRIEQDEEGELVFLQQPTGEERRAALAKLLDEVSRGRSHSFVSWIDQEVIARFGTVLDLCNDQARRITQLELQLGYLDTEFRRLKSQLRSQSKGGPK